MGQIYRRVDMNRLIFSRPEHQRAKTAELNLEGSGWVFRLNESSLDIRSRMGGTSVCT